jgi:hypothetical protein
MRRRGARQQADHGRLMAARQFVTNPHPDGMVETFAARRYGCGSDFVARARRFAPGRV